MTGTLEMTQLRGICWDHTRGYVPLVAAGQRYHEEHPNVEILWEKRSLRAFGESSLETLCSEFDLLVIDHPFCGEMAMKGCLQALDSILAPTFLNACKANAVGPSFESYCLDDHLWALPVDTACPIAAYRADILNKANLEIPTTWVDVIQLADKGRVIFPGIDTDAILHVLSLCLHEDGQLFAGTNFLTSSRNLRQALGQLKNLSDRCPPECLDMNPIQVFEALARSTDFAYCPFAFGYSNYSREGYADNLVLAGDPPTFDGRPLRTVLGGAGIALSANGKHPPIAADFAAFCMSKRIQKGIYAMSGGQPGHRQAWEDADLNHLTNGFFERTRTAMERSYLRPRYTNFIPFQHASGVAVNRFLKGHISHEEAASTIEGAYRDSFR